MTGECKRDAARILTFGCRLNAYESEVMRGHAETAGLSDAVIVNTCAVTGEAERQARQAIRKARRENPGAQIIVTGCAAQIDPQGFAGMAEVDRVLGNEEKLKLEKLPAGEQRAGAGERHHGGHRDGAPAHRRLCRTHPRLRAGAAGLRPPLHLLHHSLRARPQPLGPASAKSYGKSSTLVAGRPCARWC